MCHTTACRLCSHDRPWRRERALTRKATIAGGDLALFAGISATPATIANTASEWNSTAVEDKFALLLRQPVHPCLASLLHSYVWKLGGVMTRTVRLLVALATTILLAVGLASAMAPATAKPG